MKAFAPLVALALLSACSGSPDPTEEESAAPQPPSQTRSGASTAPEEAGKPATLTLEGLGDLRIGSPVPSGSSFASSGTPMPGSDCRILSSPQVPGAYVLVEGGTVRRITLHGDAEARLVEGIGVGSSEAEVRSAFPGFVETPAKYVEAPAKELTQPGEDPRLRFEIDSDGRVDSVHVGVMPQLGYVEGCS